MHFGNKSYLFKRYPSYPTLLSEPQILLLKAVIFRNELIIFKSFEAFFSKSAKKGTLQRWRRVSVEMRALHASLQIPPFFSCKMSLQFMNFISGET
ncbi:hypothetical protein AMJ86_03060 [bacterium SM23_57]|nr:MAG: hypothetical protein AMJ86_03060 [bacterium SM23_57]